ncbi:MAG TPA: PAS domain S-box protein, partial [Thermodesulfovibrionales bacterium]|nr:PAS domain S-box protein [Thermodesulfovibrionales bacterium]
MSEEPENCVTLPHLTKNYPVKCWELLECKEGGCPAYQSRNLHCWLIPGTHCNSKIQGEFIEKIELCCDCTVLKTGMSPASMKVMLRETSKQIDRYRKIVKDRDEELEKIGLELAISLSEVFEALKRIASGDPSVRISESSKIDLICRLKHMVNTTASEIKVIVDQCHEFAICLAEHFDVFQRVSRGDLSARVSGGSGFELMESMKKVINTTIDSISREISSRERAEEEMRRSEEKYRTIFDNTGTPTIIVDDDATISLANAEFEKFAGDSKKELERKKTWLNFVMSDDLDRVKEWYAAGPPASKGAPAYCDFRFVNMNGSVRDTLAVLSRIPGTKKRVLSFLETTERKHREMEAIVTMTTALRSAPNRMEMLSVVINEVISLLKTDGAALAILDSVTNETIIEIALGSWTHWTGVRLPQGDGISGHVIETGKPYLNNNIHLDSSVARPELIGDLRSAACVPLMTQGRAIGAIWVGRKSEIAEYEVRLLTAICEIAANAIHRATLNEQTEQRFQRLSALHGIDMAITASLDLRVTLNILLDHVT